MKNKRMTSISVMLVAASAASFLALTAKAEDKNDASAIEQVSISTSQAISIAESQVKGKVTRVELEKEKGNLLYDVEVYGGGQTTDVKIDAKSGKVLKAQLDAPDNQGGEDEKDEGEEGND